MTTTDTETVIKPWERLRELVEADDSAGLEGYLDSLAPSEAIHAVLRLDPEIQDRVLMGLSPAEAADLLEEIPDEHAADLIERLEPSDAASIVTEMVSDEQADLLSDLDAADAAAILEEMEPADAAEARQLASYADDVAGGLMITEILRFDETARVGDVVDDLRARSDELNDYFTRYAYVVSATGRLVGVVAVRELLLQPPRGPIADVSTPAVFVAASTPLDDLRSLFAKQEFVAAPVVDRRGRLLGAVLLDDVREALAERTDQERLRMQGIVGGDEIRTLPLLVRARRRLSWLSVNVVLNIVAASVIALYLDTLSAVIALAVFLPIISDMSGCSGNQAVAVSMRELALGIVKPTEVFRVWIKEVSIGAMNGAALGCLLGGVAWAWKGNPYLGLVVGGALAVNTVVSVSIGGTVPLILKRFRIDPAIASGPILTTVTDLCGFFFVLSFASLMIAKLT